METRGCEGRRGERGEGGRRRRSDAGAGVDAVAGVAAADLVVAGPSPLKSLLAFFSGSRCRLPGWSRPYMHLLDKYSVASIK